MPVVVDEGSVGGTGNREVSTILVDTGKWSSTHLPTTGPPPER